MKPNELFLNSAAFFLFMNDPFLKDQYCYTTQLILTPKI